MKENPTERPLMVSSDHKVNVSVSLRGSSSKPWGTGTQKSLNETEFFSSMQNLSTVGK